MSSKNEIVNAIKEWGLQNSNVNCILHIGSLINNDNDKYSDIDVIVFCNNVSTFLFEKEWVNEINPFKICYTQINFSGGMPMKRIVFSNGIELDLTPVKYNEILKAFIYCKISKTFFYKILSNNLKDEIENNIQIFNEYTSNGMKYIVDKKNISRSIEFISKSFPKGSFKVTHSMFEENYNYFFHQIIRESIRIVRGELYASKECAEYFSKAKLRELIEWYMKLEKGMGLDTYHNGKKLEYWCDEKILKKMAGIYGYLDFESSKNALFNTFNLYTEIATVVSIKIGYNINFYVEVKDFTEEHVNSIFGDIKKSD